MTALKVEVGVQHGSRPVIHHQAEVGRRGEGSSGRSLRIISLNSSVGTACQVVDISDLASAKLPSRTALKKPRAISFSW
ncbi:MAG: hypothetical protein CM1200mP34_4790 [Verrucomicrobiales bacterium]|nr:MAG: hypothetical protein CM1200mP34_4790 [Verrucomicrobiales bacterium]